MMFQTSDTVLHHLCGEVDRPLRSILTDFMKLDIHRSCDPFTVSIDTSHIRNLPHLKMLMKPQMLYYAKHGIGIH